MLPPPAPAPASPTYPTPPLSWSQEHEPGHHGTGHEVVGQSVTTPPTLSAAASGGQGDAGTGTSTSGYLPSAVEPPALALPGADASGPPLPATDLRTGKVGQQAVWTEEFDPWYFKAKREPGAAGEEDSSVGDWGAELKGRGPADAQEGDGW